MERDQAIKYMQDLLRAMVSRKGSDLFITSGFPPAMKVDGKMTPAGAAGGHFNPMNTPHGAPSDASGNRHVGDLGNVTADDQGMVNAEMLDSVIALDGSNSIVGKALMVHAGRDDLTSQPSGDSGARIACGVIRAG